MNFYESVLMVTRVFNTKNFSKVLMDPSLLKKTFFSSVLLAVLFGVFPVSAQMIGPEPPSQKPSNASESSGIGSTLKKGFQNIFKKQSLEEKNTENTPSSSINSAALENPSMPAPAQKIPSRPAPPKRSPLLTKPTLARPNVEVPKVSQDSPPLKNMLALDDPNNPLGLARARKQLDGCAVLFNAGKYPQAKACFSPVRQWLMDSTEAHISLYKTLSSVSNAKAQAELEKQLALEFAMLRDKAFLYNGRMHIQEKNYHKAVKDLIEVVKSQPRSDMGLQAYQLLQSIGFTQQLQIAD